MPDTRVNIRPGVSILSVLRHLNYRPWFALAEFVDNALQSFLEHRERLIAIDGDQVRLKVEIEVSQLDEGRITIRDTAAGIQPEAYDRAFRAAAIPPDRSGLSEFGMGMKSAACWFAREWQVRTSALGEPVERTVRFDIADIVTNSVEDLVVDPRVVPASAHYTEIILIGLHKPPQGRTITKIKEHLASIYRVFLRDGTMELRFDGQLLTFNEPAILSAPFFKTPAASPVTWRKEIDFDFGLGMRASGFAALRETGSTSGAGFGLFRRGRLIEGSADEGYRPEVIFGKSNSFTYQRLFGELHLEGFQVSHTKDGFQWDEHEDIFLELLREELDGGAVPLLRQAEHHRVRAKPEDLTKGAETAISRAADAIGRDLPPVLAHLTGEPPAPDPPQELPAALSTSRRVIETQLNGAKWQIVLELSADPHLSDWVEMCDHLVADSLFEPPCRRVGLRVALAHPFMTQFAGADPGKMEPLILLAAALGLAEIAAKDGGAVKPGTVRRNVNKLLLSGLPTA